MNRELIKVGYCIAYDWEMLRYSLPLVYAQADVICLSLDKDCISWSGKEFVVDKEALLNFISLVDTGKKISLYEDDFHLPELSARENEVRQRTLIADFMKKGGWHIQLDCDEYFVDFSSFVNYLRSFPKLHYEFNVCCPLVTLFKKTETGFLYIQPTTHRDIEYIQIASRHPHYEHGRRNGYFNIYSNYSIVHQSWAREEDEIKQKLNSWGHVKDFDTQSYFTFWKSLSDSNYKAMINFHPVNPEVWPALKSVKANSVEECISYFKSDTDFSLPPLKEFLKNSRFFARLKQLFD
jgi:hypothetical protein